MGVVVQIRLTRHQREASRMPRPGASTSLASRVRTTDAYAEDRMSRKERTRTRLRSSAGPLRREADSLGEKAVPRSALYGLFTQRARETFDLSGQRTHPEHIRSLGLIKKAAARANRRLGLLPPRLARAIEWAADRVIAGDVADAFVLDAFQAGAGTPSHMNANEVIADLANP